MNGADLIVVGAGSSGSVIAARVSERSDRDVLLLEAGPDYAEADRLPTDLVDGTRNSMRAHDWGMKHRPTPAPVRFDFPRGKVVGGSSAVNTCIALRGQPHDYDEWASLGLPDWTWNQCLPAFKRLETDLDFDNEWHGRAGPVRIRRHRRDELVPWQAGFLDGCATLGFAACDDHNDPTTTGYGPHAMNKIDGRRQSAALSYLTGAVRTRENLRVWPKTLVSRVLTQNGRVVGIEVERDGARAVLATRRVVLSAGAIATPGILLRSGIGPRAEVERLGVDLVQHLPAVGRRLLDHPGTGIFLAPRWSAMHMRDPLIQTTMRYTSEGSPYPNDMQLQPGSHVPLTPLITLPLVSLVCCVGKPRGHGTLSYRSADPRALPTILSNFLVDAADRAAAVEAMELAYLVARSSPLRKLAHFLWPRERVLESRARIDAWISRACGSGYHPCGTVPMGSDATVGTETAAVDGRGRVPGVEGLFIADASIMPTIPSSNTNLPTLMIGERFGAWLRDGDI